MAKHLLDRFLKRVIRKGILEVVRSDSSIAKFGSSSPGYPEIRIRIKSPEAERHILLDPRIGAAEAFMDGQLTIERGDIMEFVSLIRSNSPWDRGGNFGVPSLAKRFRNEIAHRLESFNHARKSQSNVKHHYDIGNALYRLFLDTDHMQYSCAYWPQDDMTLEQAQEAKLAHIAAKLALSPNQRVLDIGCGWGGMAIYLAQKANVTVHGITLSEEQLALAQERAHKAGVADRIQFELVDYRNLVPRGMRYDRIVSVGMFEHVGRPQFERFFRDCANLLKDDGVMLLHTIGRMGPPGSTDAFTRKYIFPGGYIPALSETIAASEKVRLIATDVENLRLHYAKTLRIWYQRCVDQQDTIVRLFDERFYRMWTFYLAGATAAFEHGSMCNFQIQYTRSRNALPLTRNYMQEAEQQFSGRI